ncbi:MAG: acyltransferase family protein, partial [Ilumatobacteraceae bacterium]
MGVGPAELVRGDAAMFFVAGVLLAQSIERHGVRHTLSSRLRRLLIPFAGYSIAAIAVMYSLGWRPDMADLASWVLPLSDPVGSAEAPGLWIPLWYLRAYLWFLLAAGAIAAAVRRMGWLVPLVLCGVLAVQQAVAPEIPMAVEDFIAYAPFVAAGMVVAVRRLPSPRASATVAVRCGAVVVVAMAGGWASTVVNADYAMTAIAGAATLGLLLAAANPLRALAAGSASLLVGWISRRSLSIYLWQGVGLLAADLLVTQRGVRGAAGIIAVGLVVAVVTVAAATAAGWLEDLAARRANWTPGRTSTAGAAIAAVALFAAMAVAPASTASARLPPSGLAVVDNAERVEAELREQGSGSSTPPTSPSVDVATAVQDPSYASMREQRLELLLDDFAERRSEELLATGNSFVSLAVVAADGQEFDLWWDYGLGVRRVESAEPIAWFSITKSAT